VPRPITWPPARKVPHFLLDLARDEALRRRLMEPRLERFIGVIYRPDTELMSHYAQASLPQQFDAYAWFNETSAVTPLGREHAEPGLPETYPFELLANGEWRMASGEW
jgi:erythromycin esterase-like protein